VAGGTDEGVPDRFGTMDCFHLRLVTFFLALCCFLAGRALWDLRVTFARFALVLERAVLLARLGRLALGLCRFAMCVCVNRLATDVKCGCIGRINALREMNSYKWKE